MSSARRPIRERLRELLSEFEFRVAGRWVVLGIAVGVTAGIGAILFWKLVVQVGATVGTIFGAPGIWDSATVGSTLPPDTRWLWASLAVGGALISGVITYFLAPEAAGGGIDEVIRQYHYGDGSIRRRAGWAKMGSAASVIGTGGSAGVEGPAGLIGAASARFISKPLGLSVSERRILMLAGAGAGIGAVFQTPLGGALFAAEVLYAEPEFEGEAIVPSLIASIVSFSIFRFVIGEQHLFHVPAGLNFDHPGELLPYMALALAIVFWSWLYVHFYRDVVERAIFGRLPVPGWSKPALGAVVTAALIFWEPLLAGGGYRAIDLVLNESLPVVVLLGLLLAKIVATSFTVGSGGSGGVFAPTVMMGTLLGASVGVLFEQWKYPWLPLLPAFAVVGMGGFFAAISRVPLAMIVMTAEMTQGYGLLVPMMLVVTLSYTFSPARFFHRYQVRNRFESPAHYGDYLVDILKRLTVRDILNERPIKTVAPHTRLQEIMPLVVNTTQDYFPVVRQNGTLHGIFSLDDVRKILGEEGLGTFLLADDLAVHDVISVTLDEGLDSVMRKFATKNLDELPVVADRERRQYVGMVTRRDVIRAYNRRMYDQNAFSPGKFTS